jgi:hypothetical protein
MDKFEKGKEFNQHGQNLLARPSRGSLGVKLLRVDVTIIHTDSLLEASSMYFIIRQPFNTVS